MCWVALFLSILSITAAVPVVTTPPKRAPPALSEGKVAGVPLGTSDMMESNVPRDVVGNNFTDNATTPQFSAVQLPVVTETVKRNQNPPEPLDVIFAIPTMRRWARDHTPSPEKYLSPLVEGLIGDMTATQKEHVHFMIYNVDKEPSKHVEALELQEKYPGLVEILKKPQRKNMPAPEHQQGSVVLEKPNGEVLEVSHDTMEWISGETHDMTSLLFDARKRAPFVIFLEDDVKPTSNAYSKICEFVHEMKRRHIEDWFMVDLYTPRINWGRNPLYVQNFERYDYECCTQAMLFRSDRLLDMLLYQTLHPHLPVDDNIRDFSREEEGSRGVYAISPNPFEHVGRYSSNPEKSSNAVEHTSLSFVP